MHPKKNIIQKFKNRWQLLQLVEVFLYALGTGFLCGLLFQSLGVAFLVFIVIGSIAYVTIRPWALSLEKVSTHIDHQLQTAEYSTSLLLAPKGTLSGLALLQQKLVGDRLENDIHQVKPVTGIKRAASVAGLLIALGSILFYSGALESTPYSVENGSEEMITFTATDSLEAVYAPPQLVDQKLTINYPNYTQKPSITTSQMNVKTVEGSRISWRITFDGPITEVIVEGMDETTPWTVAADATFTKSFTPSTSGYYNFRFTDTTGANFVSDLYAIELVKDKAPVVDIKELAQFSTFDYKEDKKLTFKTQITDDFGIGSAQIVATVSKGSGESVKFREERISFDNTIALGVQSLKLSKQLDLDQLKMEPGDELYFYVEATDLKAPKVNITRSETFFAVIKDTVTDGFAVSGTLGADLMPDYFRSQRQLIIDTEKLIKEKPNLTEKEFRYRSNELGFDQKALRLKYGQFMGDEEDSGIATSTEIPEVAIDPDDPTAAFRHDHDDENEHNIVDHDHEEEHSDVEEEESPLEEYLHNHDDPEESTLFTESLRSKLQQAMAQMWDAELHLRLYKPENSLPYQYMALKLIQEIKNSARIYVHRIGFDPPPIKEDKRLTGELDEITNFYKKETLTEDDAYSAMRKSVEILEDRLQSHGKITVADKDVFAKAGEELSTIAISEPGKHLATLQRLKRLTEEKTQPKNVWRAVQKGLLYALPKVEEHPKRSKTYESKLKKLLIKELEASD